MHRAERRRLDREARKRGTPAHAAALADTFRAAFAAYHQGKLDEAEAGFAAVLREDARHIDALHFSGLIAQRRGDLDEADRLLQRALRLADSSPAIHANLGNLRHDQGVVEDAVACYRRALELAPEKWGVYNNLGNALRDLGRFAEAVDAYMLAMRDPGPYAGDILKNLALSLIAMGRWEEGWAAYETRWRSQELSSARRPFPWPLWDGSPPAGRRILLWGEQGLGDEILYASCLPDALRLGPGFVIECAPRLVPLVARSFPTAEVHASRWQDADTGAAAIDAHLPFGSLPRLFRRSLADFPRRPGFLKADATKAAAWRDRLADLGSKPKIGLCWRSINRAPRRRQHYAAVADLGPLLALDGVEWINLQYDECAEERREVQQRFGVELRHWNDLDQLADIDGVAALIANLDLVISAGTAVSTLAGALGVPTLQFGAFRSPAVTLENGGSPWFPATRLYSWREAGGWQPMFARLREEAAIRLAGRGS